MMLHISTAVLRTHKYTQKWKPFAVPRLRAGIAAMTDKEKKHGMRTLWLRLAATGLACLLTLAGLEIILRFLPVQSYVPYQPVNNDNPVARYRPGHPFVYSNHWNFQDINHGRTNAQGFVSDFDYDADGSRPLIAVVGDSYIEARMVQFSQTMQETIRAGLHGAVRVYAFAMNGAALSQYLAFAKEARDTCRPDVLVVNIVSNDFDESFSGVNAIPRFHYFTEDANGNLYPHLQGSYRPAWLREMLSHSALVRYAYFHVRITDVPRKIRRITRSLPGVSSFKSPPPPAPASADRFAERLSISQRAADAFLNLLPAYAGLPPASIVLVLDGQRLSLYRGRHKQDAFFESMRRYIVERAAPLGYEIIDMHPVFERDFTIHGQRFEFTHDAHWNARAHGLAGRAVVASQTIIRHASGPSQLKLRVDPTTHRPPFEGGEQ